MIGPELLSIESKQATRERDYSDIFDPWRFLLRIESRDSPVLVWLLLAAKDVDRSIDECVAADLRADVDLANNIALFVVLKNALLIPLAQIQVRAVVTKERPREIRTGEKSREAFVRRIPMDVAIVVKTFADRETHFAIA